MSRLESDRQPGDASKLNRPSATTNHLIDVNSFYDAESNEVAAFEELIGCHGGMGGFQTRPFVLYPAELELETDELIGAAAVYHQFKSWLAQLHNTDGQE